MSEKKLNAEAIYYGLYEVVGMFDDQEEGGNNEDEDEDDDNDDGDNAAGGWWVVSVILGLKFKLFSRTSRRATARARANCAQIKRETRSDRGRQS